MLDKLSEFVSAMKAATQSNRHHAKHSKRPLILVNGRFSINLIANLAMLSLPTVFKEANP